MCLSDFLSYMDIVINATLLFSGMLIAAWVFASSSYYATGDPFRKRVFRLVGRAILYATVYNSAVVLLAFLAVSLLPGLSTLVVVLFVGVVILPPALCLFFQLAIERL
jgi:hypothetical protein